jgi:hypothetical protein
MSPKERGLRVRRLRARMREQLRKNRDSRGRPPGSPNHSRPLALVLEADDTVDIVKRAIVGLRGELRAEVRECECWLVKARDQLIELEDFARTRKSPSGKEFSG